MNRVYFIEEYKAGETPTIDIGEWINQNLLSKDPHLQLDIHATAVTHNNLTRVYCWYMSCDADEDVVYMNQFFDVPEEDDAEDVFWGRPIRPQKTWKHDTPYEYKHHCEPVNWDIKHSYVPDPSCEDNPLDEPQSDLVDNLWQAAKDLQRDWPALK